MGGQGSGRWPKGSKRLEPGEKDQFEDIQRRIATGETIQPAEILSNRLLGREVIQVTVERLLESEDKELAEIARGLTLKAMYQANNILDHGEQKDRMIIIRLLVGNAAKLIGSTSTTTVEEGRVALAEVLDTMREKELVSASSTVATITPTTDDSD